MAPSSGGMAPTALPRSSPSSSGFSPPAARPPAPRRHDPSPTGRIPAPAVADQRAQSRFLSREGQCNETKLDFLEHPALGIIRASGSVNWACRGHAGRNAAPSPSMSCFCGSSHRPSLTIWFSTCPAYASSFSDLRAIRSVIPAMLIGRVRVTPPLFRRFNDFSLWADDGTIMVTKHTS
jgi:hypothetical protein